MSNFWQRTIYGALFVAAVLTSVFWHFYLFAFLFLLFSIITSWELNLLRGVKKPALNIISVGLLFLTASLYMYNIMDALVLLVNVIPAIFLLLILLLNKGKAIDELKHWISSILYPGLGFVFMVLLMFPPFTDFHYSNSLFLVMLVLVWTNDTFAYLSGRLVGKTKIFPVSSPKKTWEGTIGGILFSMVAAYLFTFAYDLMSVAAWLGFAVVVSVASIFGDYFESRIKRKAGVKDSGNFLPGHGGALDRLDSLIFAAPAAYIYVLILSSL